MALPMKKSAKTIVKKVAMKASAKKFVKKGPMKKAMKAKGGSVIAKGVRARSAVFSGSKQKTQSGLSKSDFVKSKTGKIVSRKMSARAKKNFAHSALAAWSAACKKARKELGLTGFVAVGGKTSKGKALYA